MRVGPTASIFPERSVLTVTIRILQSLSGAAFPLNPVWHSEFESESPSANRTRQSPRLLPQTAGQTRRVPARDSADVILSFLPHLFVTLTGPAGGRNNDAPARSTAPARGPPVSFTQRSAARPFRTLTAQNPCCCQSHREPVASDRGGGVAGIRHPRIVETMRHRTLRSQAGIPGRDGQNI